MLNMCKFSNQTGAMIAQEALEDREVGSSFFTILAIKVQPLKQFQPSCGIQTSDWSQPRTCLLSYSLQPNQCDGNQPNNYSYSTQKTLAQSKHYQKQQQPAHTIQIIKITFI